MDTLAFLTLLACGCMLTGCDGVPVGDEWRCPALPCPAPPPQCRRLAPTYYWNNQSGVEVLCRGCDFCPLSPHGQQQDASSVEQKQEERRELDSHENCEEILCAALPPNCVISATREPSQLVGHSGQPCPVCPVCLDYVADLTPLAGR